MWQGLRWKSRKTGEFKQKAPKITYPDWVDCSCLITSSFAAFQVGWFPSTYVEEEDWLPWIIDVCSASSQGRPPPVSIMLLSHSVCPASQISSIKPRETDLRGSGSALKNPLLPSDRLTHRADVKSQIPGVSRHISPLCGPVCPCGPLGSACAVPR